MYATSHGLRSINELLGSLLQKIKLWPQQGLNWWNYNLVGALWCQVHPLKCTSCKCRREGHRWRPVKENASATYSNLSFSLHPGWAWRDSIVKDHPNPKDTINCLDVCFFRVLPTSWFSYLRPISPLLIHPKLQMTVFLKLFNTTFLTLPLLPENHNTGSCHTPRLPTHLRSCCFPSITYANPSLVKCIDTQRWVTSEKTVWSQDRQEDS